MNQAFVNLLQNAIQAVEGQGKIHLTVETHESEARVVIADSGRGMTAAQLKSAFDFAFTKRSGRVRLQLGLTTARRAVEEAGGTLDQESKPGEGTRVQIMLPTVKGRANVPAVSG